MELLCQFYNSHCFSVRVKSHQRNQIHVAIIPGLLRLHAWSENTALRSSDLEGDKLEETSVLCGSVSSSRCTCTQRKDGMQGTTNELPPASLPLPSAKGLPSANTLSNPVILCIEAPSWQ